MSRFEGKVALITGAGSGIGACTALRFVEEGGIAFGYDLKDSDTGDWAQAIAKEPRCKMFVGSVTDEHTLADAVEQIVAEHGAVDVLVNCAGFSITGSVHDTSIEDWDLQIDVNLKGTFLASRAVLKPMMASGSGSIVNLSSALGLEGGDFVAAYNAAKGAIVTLTKNMAIDYATHGIRVNAICPGYIATPGIEMVDGELRDAIAGRHMMRRFGQPVEIANVILFLASEDASFVTGISMPVDGGFTAGKHFNVAGQFGGEAR